MNKSIILLKHNSFIYENQEYDFQQLEELEYSFKQRRKIILLEQELYFKQFAAHIKNNKLKKFVEEKIEDVFPQNGEVLYDYEQNSKKDKVIIYSIKGSSKVEQLCRGSNDVEIIPIQFILKNTMNSILPDKNKSYQAVIKYDDYYYYILCEKGEFYYNFISRDLKSILNEVSKNGSNGDIYIDNNIAYDTCFLKEFQIIKKNIVGVVDEKIYKK